MDNIFKVVNTIFDDMDLGRLSIKSRHVSTLDPVGQNVYTVVAKVERDSFRSHLETTPGGKISLSLTLNGTTIQCHTLVHSDRGDDTEITKRLFDNLKETFMCSLMYGGISLLQSRLSSKDPIHTNETN